MRILMWTEQFAPDIGGIEIFTEHLIRQLQVRGYEFCVITSMPNQGRPVSTPDLPRCQIHRFNFRQAFLQRQLSLMKRIVDEIQAIKADFCPDLIHLNSQLMSLFFLDRLLRTSTHHEPILFTLHTPVRHPQNLDVQVTRQSLVGQFLARSACITTVSKSLMADTIAVMPELQPRLSSIWNGLPFPSLPPTPLPMQPPICLCIGRVVEEKGFDLVIQAFVTVLQHHPTARLTIAGAGVALTALQAQANALGIADAVDFLGWVAPEAIPTVINTSTVVIAPTRYREPFGLVALQAAQMGRPVIASDQGGLTEVVQDQTTGLLVESNNPDAIATAICHLLQDPSRTMAMGAAARAYVRQTFSMKRSIDAYDQRYRELSRISRTSEDG